MPEPQSILTGAELSLAASDGVTIVVPYRAVDIARVDQPGSAPRTVPSVDVREALMRWGYPRLGMSGRVVL